MPRETVFYNIRRDTGFPRFAENTNKCNQFVNDILSMVGVQPPQNRGRLGFVGMGGPPRAEDWANTNLAMLGKWEIVSGPAKPGDVIAIAFASADASGHMGIVVAQKETASAVPPSHGDAVVINDWGFRRNQNPVIRRLNCHFF